MHYDYLIHNGTAVTVNQAFDIIEDAVIGIQGSTIVRVERRGVDFDSGAARHSLDARGGLILPGLVNGHTHLPMTLFRGLADDLPLMEWLHGHIFPAEARLLTPESVYRGALLGCMELLRGGVTTCCDGYFYETEVARAVQTAGLRAVVGQGVIDFPAPGIADPRRNVAHAVEFVSNWQHVNPLIQPAIFCHSAYTCSGSTLQAAHARARRLEVPFLIHVSETQTEQQLIQQQHGCTPVAWLNRLGVLDSGTILIHGVWLNRNDIVSIAQKGSSLIHTPESNMKLAAGIAPVPDCLAAGVRVGLGTDGCASNNDQDMFREMGTAARLHKVHRLDPSVMPAGEVLGLATRQGAAAIGLGDLIGSLEPGKQADLIILDTARPHLAPLYHAHSHLVYAAGAKDVRDVMVAGRLLVQNGRCRHLDEEAVMAAVVDLCRHNLNCVQ